MKLILGKKMSIARIIDLECQSLTIDVEIEIFRLIMKEPIININNADLEKENWMKLKVGMKHYIEYVMNEAEVNVFKTSLAQKAMTKEVVGLWSLEAYPRGMEEDEGGNTGLHLMLCRLPPNVDAIKLMLNFTVKRQMHHHIIKVYTLNTRGYGVSLDECISIKKHRKLTFTADIEILHISYYNNMYTLQLNERFALVY